MDFNQLFDHSLFKYDTKLIPEAVKLYDKLHIKHEPLSLIPPQFEVPLPSLQPAVFMPCMRELPPPALDLFDLDEHFSNEKLRLAQLTNKCTDEDLEYYVREGGEIMVSSFSFFLNFNLVSINFPDSQFNLTRTKTELFSIK